MIKIENLMRVLKKTEINLINSKQYFIFNNYTKNGFTLFAFFSFSVVYSLNFD